MKRLLTLSSTNIVRLTAILFFVLALVFSGCADPEGFFDRLLGQCTFQPPGCLPGENICVINYFDSNGTRKVAVGVVSSPVAIPVAIPDCSEIDTVSCDCR